MFTKQIKTNTLQTCYVYKTIQNRKFTNTLCLQIKQNKTNEIVDKRNTKQAKQMKANKKHKHSEFTNTTISETLRVDRHRKYTKQSKTKLTKHNKFIDTKQNK